MVGNSTFICESNRIGERDTSHSCAKASWIDPEYCDARVVVVEVLVEKRMEIAFGFRLGVRIHHRHCARHFRCLQRDVEIVSAISEGRPPHTDRHPAAISRHLSASTPLIISQKANTPSPSPVTNMYGYSAL